MSDFLDTLAMNATKTIDNGYYKTTLSANQPKVSLKKAIADCPTNAVITEIKGASPSLGTIRTEVNPSEIAKSMERAGAVGISVLTEPTHFNGSLSALVQAREAVGLPILMKDFVIVADQIEVAAQLGANVILLIKALFDRNCCEMSLEKTIAFAHTKGLEVLLETHTQAEYQSALETNADLIGINNRNLATLKIDLNTTTQILQKNPKHDKTIISESGIQTRADLEMLKRAGANAFLIGSSIMQNQNIEEKIKEFTRI